MRKSALGWLRPTRNPQETRSRVPHLFERLEPRLLLSVVFENVQPTDPATPDQYAIYLDQQAQGAQASQLSVPGGELAVTDGGSVATLEALARFGEHVQVLLFTCHDHVVEFARAANAVLLQVPAPVAQ